MDKELIERLAGQTGLGEAKLYDGDEALQIDMVTGQRLIGQRWLARFAALIAEECAKVCALHAVEPQVAIYTTIYQKPHEVASLECAEAIRAKFTP